MAREISHRYLDPLDAIWLACAKRIGFHITRTEHAYATSDGKGTIGLAPEADLDADDCLAQMLLHEICHSLVEGDAGLVKEDWGLGNQDARDEFREHACLRLQALLLTPLGLRNVLAPTTDFRAFYDALADDPLDDSESSRLARIAEQRIFHAPWHPHLSDALAATRDIARTLAQHNSCGTVEGGTLWSRAEPEQKQHSVGFCLPLVHTNNCGDCAFFSDSFCNAAKKSCRHDDDACERFTATLDCTTCAACCREGFGTLEMPLEDPFVRKYPSLVVLHSDRAELPRANGSCGCLQELRCSHYDDRPEPCREFETGSENCVFARRRLGFMR